MFRFFLIYRIKSDALGERDTDTPSTLDVDSTDAIPRVSSHSVVTNSSFQPSHSDRLSQSSGSASLSQQTLSQDVCMGDVEESDLEIEDFDDDIIW